MSKDNMECESGFKSSGSSTLKVEWWQVILLFIAAMGVNYGWLLSHENRITKSESSTEYLVKTVDELKILAKETNIAVHEIKRNGK